MELGLFEKFWVHPKSSRNFWIISDTADMMVHLGGDEWDSRQTEKLYERSDS
jgi:hypothetical protein